MHETLLYTLRLQGKDMVRGVVLDLNEVVDEISEFSERWTKVPRGQLDDDICPVR